LILFFTDNVQDTRITMMIGTRTSLSGLLNVGNMSFSLSAGVASFDAPARVLLLANDMAPIDSVPNLLAGTACDVTRVASVTEALARIEADTFDAIIVDFRPDLFGYDAVCRLRVARVGLPILFVSARSTQDARARALAVGADDVVVLPLSQDGLLERLRALPTAQCATARSILQVGALELDLAARTVSVDGEMLALNAREYTVLEMLVTRAGTPVAKDALHARLADAGAGWADAVIASVRKKLTAAGGGVDIRAVRGLGYVIGARNGLSLRWMPQTLAA